MIIGDRLDISKENLNGNKLGHGSDHFREKCLKAGYTLTNIYPVYHQGWELDEWAADATKDGKKYFLTTNHNALEETEIPRFSLKSLILSILAKI